MFNSADKVLLGMRWKDPKRRALLGYPVSDRTGS